MFWRLAIATKGVVSSLDQVEEEEKDGDGASSALSMLCLARIRRLK